MARIRTLLALAFACASFATFAQAPWPSKTVKIIAVFPPGGSVDQVSRVLAAQLTQQTGQQFIVMGTRQGVVKKTDLEAFSNPRAGGIIARR